MKTTTTYNLHFTFYPNISTGSNSKLEQEQDKHEGFEVISSDALYTVHYSAKELALGRVETRT